MTFSYDRRISSLSASDLSIERQDCLLFEPVSFHLKAGELLWIQGPNGVGKSSLLRALCGFLPAASGQIHWGTANEAPRGNLVYLGHSPGLRASLSVWENVVDDFASPEDARAALQRYGLDLLLETPVSALSRGQCQRVALATLTRPNSPGLWILDEPFTALDAQGQALLQADLIAHCKNGGIGVVASHQRFHLNISTQHLDLKAYE